MKKLNITKERFVESKTLQSKYGTLKYVSESGRIFKTDKGRILKFVVEAREYIDDNSIDIDSAEEFILFDDPNIFEQIASIQQKEGEKIQYEVQSGEVTPNEVADAVGKAANKSAIATIASGVASSAINSATSLATSKAALGVAAMAGYGKVVQKAGEVGDEYGGKVGQAYFDLKHKEELKQLDDNVSKTNQEYKDTQQRMNNALAEYSKISNLGHGRTPQEIMMDKRAMYIATQLKNGDAVMDYDGGRKIEISREQAIQELKDNGYEINKDGIVNKITSAGIGAATGSAINGAGFTLFGLGAATLGWIVAGVATAAIITPYIYDKVRACAKAWLSDIIAEIKFKADGKEYRCFYDLKENKWILTYANVKWSSYMDNKLDKETTDEFFKSKFFNDFLQKCRKAFALLFSTGKNEVVFKALPEIKDAPKELKSILEKIYDNKGAISRNLFNETH